MLFLLDSDTLIQAKNEYYGFDLCPGFWDWLDRKSEEGVVASVQPILKELSGGNDELKTWAETRSAAFFKEVDQAAVDRAQQIVGWVMAQNFRPDAKQRFLSGADSLLIAYALAHGHTVATHEVHREGERRNVKIPAVCSAFNVPCVRLVHLLREQGARFVLEN
jgi:hypothetical protein